MCIYRIPLGQSIIAPGSYCPKCGKPLKLKELIPILSYVLVKGRCRYCKKDISPRYPMVELLSGLLFLLIYLKFGLSWLCIYYIILISCLIVITFIDLKHGIIPNSIVFFSLAAGLIFNSLSMGRPFMDGLFGMAIGGGTLLAIAVLAFLIMGKEGMGGGDIKLMGAVGVFLGWKLTILAMLLSFYLGGIIGITLLITRRGKPGDSMPYGPFIAVSSVITILCGKEIINWYLARF